MEDNSIFKSYKNVDAVAEVSHQVGDSNLKVARLVPIGVTKG
jgi:RNA-splicing ligase RtcB